VISVPSLTVGVRLGRRSLGRRGQVGNLPHCQNKKREDLPYWDRVTGLEAPFEFCRVTVTDTTTTEVTDWVAVASVNGTVSVNCVPKGFDWPVFAYQVVKALCRGTEMLFEMKVSLVAGAKANWPLIMSRVEEKPVTTTVTPPATCCKVTLLMNGTPGAFTMV